jgi:hypothetical protein
MSNAKQLSLDCCDINIEGYGNELTFTTRGHRRNKLGNREEYELKLKVPRWTLQRLARQIATMHERDRARLSRELRRIEMECEAIKQPETKES